MKNSKLVKVVIGAIVSLIVIIMANQVFADDVTDLTNLLGNSSSTNNSVSNTTNNTTNSTSNSTSNRTSNNTVANNSLNSLTNNSVLTTNNTSVYNNSSLPKTGIEDHIPATILLVVFGVSAIYAYKKIQDYRNI